VTYPLSGGVAQPTPNATALGGSPGDPKRRSVPSLGWPGTLLFVCDGSAGLKVYNSTDAKNISSNLIYTYPDIKAFDAIPIGDILVLIGDDGLYQYNYSNISNITLMSSILVVK